MERGRFSEADFGLPGSSGLKPKRLEPIVCIDDHAQEAEVFRLLEEGSVSDLISYLVSQEYNEHKRIKGGIPKNKSCLIGAKYIWKNYVAIPYGNDNGDEGHQIFFNPNGK
jgi:hypothetical protein